VNGQAPPGARTLEDVGRWRCGGCSAWNGKEKPREDDVTRLVRDWEAERKAKDRLSGDGGVKEMEEVEDEGVVVEAEAEADSSGEDTPPPSRNTRSKSKGRGKK